MECGGSGCSLFSSAWDDKWWFFSGIGGRQRLKMLNGRNGSDFQFVRDCAQWMVSLVKNVVGSQRDAIL
jgi:hypothetical protein